MARMIVMAQKGPGGGMLVRGLFTQKKKLWEALEQLEPAMSSMVVFDDVSASESPVSYRKVCDMLRVNGRAVIALKGGDKEFLMIESEVNRLRDWDVGQDGVPVPNPVRDDAGPDVGAGSEGGQPEPAQDGGKEAANGSP
jgi:hypothetical protein